MEQNLPVLPDETYALIRRYINGDLSKNDLNQLEDQVKDIPVHILAKIIFNAKNTRSAIISESLNLKDEKTLSTTNS